MTVPSPDELLFIALGGAGEIGMNLNLYGHAGKWLMVDLGITFGDDSTPGVDIITQGVQSTNVVVRGFNNIFSGALYTLTDNRMAGVPSLRVNVMHFVPTTDEDLQRMEVVLGPGSALYGPNTANGVLHLTIPVAEAAQPRRIEVQGAGTPQTIEMSPGQGSAEPGSGDEQ